MGRISVEVMVKIVEVVTNILVIIVDTIKGGKKNDGSGSNKKK